MKYYLKPQLHAQLATLSRDGLIPADVETSAGIRRMLDQPVWSGEMSAPLRAVLREYLVLGATTRGFEDVAELDKMFEILSSSRCWASVEVLA